MKINCSRTLTWLHRPGAVQLLPVLTALFALVASNAWATLTAYEPFNYTIGTLPTYASGTPTQYKGGGFASGYNGGAGVGTAQAGLAYPGLLATNNSLRLTSSYLGENLASPISSGTVYISFLYYPGTQASSGNNGGNLVGLEVNTGGTGMFIGVTAAYSATQGKYGVNKQIGYNDNSGNLWQSATPNITYGTTNFIVVKLTGTGSGWTGSIWVNPTAGTSTEPATTGTFSSPQFTLSSFSMVNPGGGNYYGFDELRVATTWGDAVANVTTPVAVVITSPTNTQTVSIYGYSINANATVSPGTITNVDFYVDAAWFTNKTGSPYTFAVSGAVTLTTEDVAALPLLSCATACNVWAPATAPLTAKV